MQSNWTRDPMSSYVFTGAESIGAGVHCSKGRTPGHEGHLGNQQTGVVRPVWAVRSGRTTLCRCARRAVCDRGPPLRVGGTNGAMVDRRIEAAHARQSLLEAIVEQRLPGGGGLGVLLVSIRLRAMQQIEQTGLERSFLAFPWPGAGPK